MVEISNQSVINDPMDDVTLPKAGQNNLWFHYNETDSVFVFIHGVLSDSRGCWLHEAENTRMYWPALIRADKRFKNPAIYLGGYYTAIDSGAYEISNCADEIFGALNRTSPLGEQPVMSKPRITFICHSTGGIVARYMLTAHSEAFAEKDVGLVLVASPSYGSKLADRLNLILRFYRHTVGKQLQWGNWSLKDLDRRFRDHINDKKIPLLRGVEFCENHFIVHWKWLPFFSSKKVVTEESAGRYFGAAKLLRNTDHFSSVKPASVQHPAHEYLLDFVATQQFTPADHEVTEENYQSPSTTMPFALT
ncbi:MAG: hypothetical protein QGH15_12610 [Kiritimatiellia bacterium]|jgi:hypothetical protein|nr:hypothetical protein [Kiritimatiellia bacterium]